MVLLCIVGPSGVGKTTISRLLRDEYGFNEVVSYTTRKPRPGEVNGVNYHFVDMFCKNDMFEWTEFSGNFYGTLAADILGEGHRVVVVDTHGADIIMQKVPDAKVVFLVPPTMGTISKRLQGQTDRLARNDAETMFAWFAKSKNVSIVVNNSARQAALEVSNLATKGGDMISKPLSPKTKRLRTND